MNDASDNRAAWLRAARWGVFTHYLAAPASDGVAAITAEAWHERVEAFDVAGLVDQLQRTGTRYYVLTIGQNTGYYCSPNETYDALVQRTPSRLSKRDLVADVAEALEAVGIRTLVYLPGHAPADDRLAVEGLVCTPDWDASLWQLRPGRYLRREETDERLSTFQRHWEAIVREWSLRWGRHVHGWWIDGCYYADRMYRHPDPPNFASFADALRAGNPDAIVAFNPGLQVPVVSHTQYEDYTAGEVMDPLPAGTPLRWHRVRIIDGFIEQAQYHILTHLGMLWGRGEPRFSAEMVAAYTHHINDLGGVVTWDVPIGATGHIPEEYIERLAYLGARGEGT